MGATNGHAHGSEHFTKDLDSAVPTPALVNAANPALFPPEQLRQVVSELEVPFPASAIEWRVTNCSKDKTRGQIMPYADQRAYTDRLNALFTPAGWTRRYTVHTSSNFQRSKDQKTVAKVFVTCDLTIFGIGSHSATGEEWTDDDNAGTSAEAQAFKRACSCFGLGRYLYYFTGIWVDLDGRKQPKTSPKLFGWATPKGWREGLRPPQKPETAMPDQGKMTKHASIPANQTARDASNRPELLRQVEAMEKPLGKGLYRGLLKSIARVWKPSDIRDAEVLQKLLTYMQSADRGLHRLQAALEKSGPDTLPPVLNSLRIKSLEHIDNLDTLLKVVLAVEAGAGSATQAQ